MEYLRSIGMKVTAVSSNDPELVDLSFPKAKLQHIVIDIHRKPTLFRDLLALVHLIRVFRTQQFDIVHSTTPKAGLLAALAGKLAGTPIRLHTFTGQPWVTMSGLLKFVCRFCDRLIGKLNTRCYADSLSQRQFLVEQNIVADSRIGVIGAGSLAGVDVKRFDRNCFTSKDVEVLRREVGVSHDAAVLIFIGRITYEKGIRELLSAFEQLRKENYAVELLLIGPFDEVNGKAMEGLRAKITSLSGVHCIGYTGTPERYLAISHILCLPSYREGFGTVVIEAAAMGLPTIGTRINGLIDAVIDGETGILIEPRDSYALVVALKRLLDQPELIISMGNAARQRCLQAFDAEVVNRNLAQEYIALLNR
jgi:glycosyltransferase involved in cell wall biosynthesis